MGPEERSRVDDGDNGHSVSLNHLLVSIELISVLSFIIKYSKTGSSDEYLDSSGSQESDTKMGVLSTF